LRSSPTGEVQHPDYNPERTQQGAHPRHLNPEPLHLVAGDGEATRKEDGEDGNDQERRPARRVSSHRSIPSD
jgi:hypothetical protein